MSDSRTCLDKFIDKQLSRADLRTEAPQTLSVMFKELKRSRYDNDRELLKRKIRSLFEEKFENNLMIDYIIDNITDIIVVHIHDPLGPYRGSSWEVEDVKRYIDTDLNNTYRVSHMPLHRMPAGCPIGAMIALAAASCEYIGLASNIRYEKSYMAYPYCRKEIEGFATMVQLDDGTVFNLESDACMLSAYVKIKAYLCDITDVTLYAPATEYRQQDGADLPLIPREHLLDVYERAFHESLRQKYKKRKELAEETMVRERVEDESAARERLSKRTTAERESKTNDVVDAFDAARDD